MFKKLILFLSFTIFLSFNFVFASANFVMKFGDWGTEDGEFEFAIDPAVDTSGNIYVADSQSHRVQKFNSSGIYVSKFGGFGDGDGKFKNPRAVAINSSNKIYVLDSGNNRVQRFSSSGVYESQFTNDFNSPSGMMIDSSGNIYVVDSGNNRVQKFNSSEVHQFSFGSLGSDEGEFYLPRGVAVDSAGNIYVADMGNKRIQKFDSSGVFIKIFSDLPANAYPYGIVVDSSDNLYVTDSARDFVYKFNQEGELITSFGGTGTANLKFNSPYGIRLDANNFIFIADTGNKRVQKISETDTAPVIYLQSSNPQNIEYGSQYVELGAYAIDNYDAQAEITSKIVIDTTSVVIDVLGNYNVSYNVQDRGGNNATEVLRVVRVVDTTAPVITLTGADPQIIDFGDEYVELGATAVDIYDGAVVVSIDTSTVDITKIGTYQVIYTATDSNSNSTESVRAVQVRDLVKPVLTLVGDDPQIIEYGDGYTELGATALDNYDGNITEDIAITTSAVNLNILGDYVVKYNVKDSSNNEADEVSRSVRVVDTTAPVITLNGINPQTLFADDEYVELGATALDNYDGEITDDIVIDISDVNMSSTGTYTIRYNVEDSSNNDAVEVLRTLNVIYRPPSDIENLDLTAQNIISWSQSFDPKLEILRYNYQIGTSANACDVAKGYTDKNTRELSVEGLLTEGVKYYVGVNAENTAHIFSSTKTAEFFYYNSDVLDVSASEENIIRSSCKIQIPASAVPEQFYILSQLEDVNNSNINQANTRIIDDEIKSWVDDFGFFVKFDMYGKATGQKIIQFAKSLTIALPYNDADDDGVIDGSNIRVEQLSAHCLNENTLRWEKLDITKIDTTNKFLEFRTTHFSTFALLPSKLDTTLLRLNVYPNPSDMNTNSVKIANLINGDLKIKIYDIMGKKVREITDADMQVNIYDGYFAEWDGKDQNGLKLASGVYIAVIKNKGQTAKEKIAILW